MARNAIILFLLANWYLVNCDLADLYGECTSIAKMLVCEGVFIILSQIHCPYKIKQLSIVSRSSKLDTSKCEIENIVFTAGCPREITTNGFTTITPSSCSKFLKKPPATTLVTPSYASSIMSVLKTSPTGTATSIFPTTTQIVKTMSQKSTTMTLAIQSSTTQSTATRPPTTQSTTIQTSTRQTTMSAISKTAPKASTTIPTTIPEIVSKILTEASIHSTLHAKIDFLTTNSNAYNKEHESNKHSSINDTDDTDDTTLISQSTVANLNINQLSTRERSDLQTQKSTAMSTEMNSIDDDVDDNILKIGEVKVTDILEQSILGSSIGPAVLFALIGGTIFAIHKILQLKDRRRQTENNESQVNKYEFDTKGICITPDNSALSESNRRVTSSSCEMESDFSIFSEIAQIHNHDECEIELETISDNRLNPTAPIEDTKFENNPTAPLEEKEEEKEEDKEEEESENVAIFRALSAYSQLECNGDPFWRICPRFSGPMPRYTTRLQYRYLSPKQADTIKRSLKRSKKKPKRRALTVRLP